MFFIYCWHTLSAFTWLFLIGVLSTKEIASNSEDEYAAKNLIANWEANETKSTNKYSEAVYASELYPTLENEKAVNEISRKASERRKKFLKQIREFNYKSFKDPILKRQFSQLSDMGEDVLPKVKFSQLQNAIDKMAENYAKAKVCHYQCPSKCRISESELREIFAKSRDPEELKWYWQQWYNKTGKPSRQFFNKYVELKNTAARMNNFRSSAEQSLSAYEDPSFEKQLDEVMKKIRPLYLQIHAYVRHKLWMKYGDSVVSRVGPIPMHLLGNLWAQDWTNIEDIITPYPGNPSFNITNELLTQHYDPKAMFKKAEEFFVSLNMTELPKPFWEKSIFEKPASNPDFTCADYVWYFKKDDVRAFRCTKVNMKEFFAIYRQVGLAYHLLAVQHLPTTFRDGGCPGFRNAIGDVISLSVASPPYLQRIGLLKNFAFDKQSEINQLLRIALDHVVLFTFGYALEKYRWAMFRRDIKPEEANGKFWELRLKYSGIVPPVVRTEKDFDAPAKRHVSADVEYHGFLVASVVMFQFQKSLCELAGQYDENDPNKSLINCNIYGSTKAGDVLKTIMSTGSSKSCPDSMEAFTGQRKISADAMLAFFKPLSDWLETENEKLGAVVDPEDEDEAEI